MATILNTPEQKVILRSVSWETYERLLAERGESPGARFHYDQGILEIMAPSFEHESLKDSIALLVQLVAIETEADFRGAGSTTFRRSDLGKGFEPDACFYIQNAPRVRGLKEIDLTQDPPPDLVIEIDITRSSLNKLAIYSAIEVPEVWRFAGYELRIFRLQGGQYVENPQSTVLPCVTASILTEFVQTSLKLETNAWVRSVRAWAQQYSGGNQ